MSSEQESIGRTAGMIAGMLTGARLTSSIPVVGPFVGAIGGALLGGEAGKRLAHATVKGVQAFADGLRDTETEAPAGA